MSNYDSKILIQKLDDFIRKYYKNQLIKGVIYFTALVLVAFLMTVILEFFGRYNSLVRGVLFYTFLTFSAYCLSKYLLIPLAHLYRIGKIISYRQASQIVGNHFSEIKDVLLNTLQLNEESKLNNSNLLEAAIEQKTSKLKPISFNAAIDLRNNLKYLRYAVLPLLAYVLILIVSPSMISDSGERIIKYNQTFAVNAPFNFEVKNKILEVDQFNDFELEVKLSGNEIPADIFLMIDGNAYKMQKNDLMNFSYTFKNIQHNTKFQFFADQFYSKDYLIEVLPKPLMLNYQIVFDYPEYTGKKDEVLTSPGDVVVPAGTAMKWKFLTKQTEQVILGFGNKIVQAEKIDDAKFMFSKKVFESENYYIKNVNTKVKNSDSMQFVISVIEDAYPVLTVDEKSDSISKKQFYFIGDASDDYGLTKLNFNYRFIKSADKIKTEKGVQQKQIVFEKLQNPQRFYHYFNLHEINLQEGDEIEYYFELWDNDGVRGAKSTRSKTSLYKAPSINELKDETNKDSEIYKKNLKETLNEAKELQKELKELQRKIKEKNSLTWEEKRKAEQLLQREKDLNKKMDELQKELKLNNQKEQDYKQQEERIVEKQAQLEKMYKEIMNDEMKELLKKMEDMLKLQNKDLLKNEMEKLQLENKDVEKELDRMLEMYKQLELEKKLEDVKNNLDKLSEKQEQLEKKNDDNTAKETDLKQEQDKLNKEFDDIKKELNEIEKLNEKLEEKQELADTKKNEKEIEQEMENSSNELSKGNKKKAKQAQKKAAEKMQQLSEKMKQKSLEQEKEEQEEDVNALREILENLVELSKEQENLMQRFGEVNSYSPQFVQMAQEQKNLKDNAKIIEDSLTALSKRVAEIRSFINKEMTAMINHMDKSNKGFSERNMHHTRVEQQSAMTNMNNLALMLSEALKKMQQDMQSQQNSDKSGDGKSKKTGKGKGGKSGKMSMGKLKKMQEEMNKQLREGMNKQEGKGQKQGEKGMGSESFARMASQQMAIRQAMQKMLSEMGAKEKEGLGGNKQLGDLQKQMEQSEKELFNKKLTTETLMRQQQILTRLLESEKAEKKQEQDAKREAEQAQEKERIAPPPNFDKYLQQKNKETELLRTVPVEMKPYFKQKANEYLKGIQ